MNDSVNDDNVEYEPDYGAPQKEEKPGINKWWLIGGGCAVFVLCILPICTIIILTLLGPEIGGVFSDIIDTLEATPMP